MPHPYGEKGGFAEKQSDIAQSSRYQNRWAGRTFLYYLYHSTRLAGPYSAMKQQRFSFLHTLAHLPRRLLITFVRGYQRFISPLFAPTCRFAPSCSAYAVQAFRRYGALKGLVLAVWRVLRCHPWGGSGYDPPRWFGEEAPRPPEPRTEAH